MARKHRLFLLGREIVPVSAKSITVGDWNQPRRAMLLFAVRYDAPGHYARRRVVTGYWRERGSRLVQVTVLP